MMLVSKEIKEYYAAQSNEKAVKFWTKREQTVLNSLINCALAVCQQKIIITIIIGVAYVSSETHFVRANSNVENARTYGLVCQRDAIKNINR